jgi:hypothetical protein
LTVNRERAERCNDSLDGASSAGFGNAICAVGSQCAKRITRTGKRGSLSRTPFQCGNSCLDRTSCASTRRVSSVIQHDLSKRRPAPILHIRGFWMSAQRGHDGINGIIRCVAFQPKVSQQWVGIV